MPFSAAESKANVAKLYAYHTQYADDFKLRLQRSDNILDSDVLSSVIACKNAKQDRFQSNYSTSTHDFIQVLGSKNHSSAVMKIDGTRHNVYIDVQKEGGYSVVNVFESLPLAHEQCSHLREPVIDATREIVQSVDNSNAIIHVIGSQTTPAGCGMQSLGLGQIVSENPSLMSEVRVNAAQDHYGHMNDYDLKQSYAKLNDDLETGEHIKFSNSLFESDPIFLAFSNSLKTAQRINKFHPNADLNKEIRVSGKEYSSLEKLLTSNKKSMIKQEGYGLLGDEVEVSTFIDHFALEQTADALNFWKRQQALAENRVDKSEKTSFGFKKGFLDGAEF